MLTPPDICGSINGTTTVSVEMITQTSLCVNKKRDSLPVKAGCQDDCAPEHKHHFGRAHKCRTSTTKCGVFNLYYYRMEAMQHTNY